MKLRKTIEDLDQVEKHLQDLYTQGEGNGGYVLDADKAIDFLSGRVVEFRANNIELQKKQKAAEEEMAQFAGIDPTKYKAAEEKLKRLEKLEEEKMKDEGNIDELVQKRAQAQVENMKAEYDQRLTKAQETIESLTGTATRYKQKLDESLVESTVMAAINEVAVPKKGAMDDIRSRAKRHWSVNEDGDLVSADLYDNDGKDIKDPKAYAQLLVQQAGHLFEPGGGGGATGNARKEQKGKKWVDNVPLETGRWAKEIASGQVLVRGVDDQ